MLCNARRQLSLLVLLFLSLDISLIESKRCLRCLDLGHSEPLGVCSSLFLLSHELFELILLDALWYFSGLVFNTQGSLFFSALFIDHLLDLTLSDGEAFLSIQELKWDGHSDVVLSFTCLWNQILFMDQLAAKLLAESVMLRFVVFFLLLCTHL